MRPGTYRPPAADARRTTEASLHCIADHTDTVWLTPDPLDPLAVLDRVQGSAGQALFVGTVRADADVREVTALDYEAYPGMAEREMRAICAEAEARFAARCAVAHRTGAVAVGQPSVAAAACAASDAVALDACEWLVDQLKQRVPVWKLQRFLDGDTEWSEGA